MRNATLHSSQAWHYSNDQTFTKTELKLIDLLRATRWMPLDYWQTNNSNGLVMVIRNYYWLNSASRVLISTCSAPLVQTGQQFFTVWPWSLTYDLDLQSHAGKGQGRPSCQKSRSKVKRFKQESTYRQTDGHTYGRYQTYYLPCYAVDKNWEQISCTAINSGMWALVLESQSKQS